MGFAAGTLSDQAEIDIDVFVFENCLFSFVVSMKRDLLASKQMVNFSKSDSSQAISYFSTLLIRLRFQGYNCE